MDNIVLKRNVAKIIGKKISKGVRILRDNKSSFSAVSIEDLSLEEISICKEILKKKDFSFSAQIYESNLIIFSSKVEKVLFKFIHIENIIYSITATIAISYLLIFLIQFIKEC